MMAISAETIEKIETRRKIYLNYGEVAKIVNDQTARLSAIHLKSGEVTKALAGLPHGIPVDRKSGFKENFETDKPMKSEVQDSPRIK